MNRAAYIFLFSMFAIVSVYVKAQTYSQALGGYLVATTVYKNDTIPLVQMREVPIYPTIKEKKKEQFYWKTVRDVKKVYPYVKIVGSEYARIEAMFDTISDEKIKKKYMRKYEKELLDKYTPVLKNFTLSQGKMMIKLISRETDKSSYALIKEFRGGFVAWWWQVFAKFVGADLKDDFDISKREQDRIIERVITLYEAGLL